LGIFYIRHSPNTVADIISIRQTAENYRPLYSLLTMISSIQSADTQTPHECTAELLERPAESIADCWLPKCSEDGR